LTKLGRRSRWGQMCVARGLCSVLYFSQADQKPRRAKAQGEKLALPGERAGCRDWMGRAACPVFSFRVAYNRILLLTLFTITKCAGYVYRENGGSLATSNVVGVRSFDGGSDGPRRYRLDRGDTNLTFRFSPFVI
jgi:hypothetical protein